MLMKANILFICGSLNQTTMMHKISLSLPMHDCFFTPFYAEGLIGQCSRMGLLDFTILGGKHAQNTKQYLAQERLPIDFGGQSRRYDLVVTCTDLIMQNNIRSGRIVLVQEGMILPEGALYYFVRYLGMPRFLANTAATGLSNAYDIFCVASPGYRELFIQRGVNPDKIVVTGIPNFDNAASYLNNNFPHRNYVLATTTSARETGMRADRIAFIHKVKQIAAGREILFKLHPNENIERAKAEIEKIIPEATIYTTGNVHEMIANCDEMVTELSSVVFTALALGKKIHADFDLQSLRDLMPIQNGGTSAQNIARICEELLEQPMPQAQRSSWSFSRLFKLPARATAE
jgi:hypothetical protein